MDYCPYELCRSGSYRYKCRGREKDYNPFREQIEGEVMCDVNTPRKRLKMATPQMPAARNERADEDAATGAASPMTEAPGGPLPILHAGGSGNRVAAHSEARFCASVAATATAPAHAVPAAAQTEMQMTLHVGAVLRLGHGAKDAADCQALALAAVNDSLKMAATAVKWAPLSGGE